MSENQSALPVISFSKLQKLLLAIARKQTPQELSDLEKFAEIKESTIARNLPFLRQLRLIDDNNQPSSLCVNLGLAIRNQLPEASDLWREASLNHPFAEDFMDGVELKPNNDIDYFIDWILTTLEKTESFENKAGAKCFIIMFENSKLINIDNKKVTIGEKTENLNIDSRANIKSKSDVDEEPQPELARKETAAVSHEGSSIKQLIPSIGINLQLQIMEFEDDTKYESLFKALRKYLIDGKEDDSND